MPKPSELEATTTPTGDEWVVVVKDGVTSKVAMSVIRAYARNLLGMDLTSTSDYVGYSDLGWTYTRDLKENPDDGDASYVYELSTADGPGFAAGVVQSVEEADFVTSKIFTGVAPYTTYYSRVRAINGVVGESNITSNYSDPCENFSATRTNNGDDTVTLNIKTHTPNTGVWVLEELEGPIRGLVRPIADDQFGELNIAIGEGKAQTTSEGAGGKLVLDGGFPKFYNTHWDDSYANDVFAEGVPAQYGYGVNAINLAMGARTTRTDKVLYMNTENIAGKTSSHGLEWKGDGSTNHQLYSFNDSIFGMVNGHMGLTLDFMDDKETQNSAHYHFIRDAGYTRAEWKNYFMDYDCVIWITAESQDLSLPENFYNGMLDYYDDGGGLFLLTDHDVFQYNINKLVRHYGVKFKADVNRTPTHDAYKVSTILANTDYLPQGMHPLFANVDPDGSLYAGTSEGQLVYMDNDAGSIGYSKTSKYVSDENRDLEVTKHTDSTETKLGLNKIIVRTANDCGRIFEAIE